MIWKRMRKRKKIDLSDLADTLKSVAHSERLAILQLFCNCGCEQMMVKSIYNELHLDQSNTSRHLGIMKKCGVLKREVKKGKTYYGFNSANDATQCIKGLLTDSV